MTGVASLVVLDPDGREVPLRSTWSGRIALLVFVRHFGCLFCRQQVAGLLPILARVRAVGAEMFVVGNGTPEEARAFRDEHASRFPVLTDPSRASYCELGMRRGVATVLRPSVLVRAVRALRRGFRQSRAAGDPLQQGGVLVIDPNGVVAWRFASRAAGEHPSADEVAAAVERAADARHSTMRR